MYDNLTANVPTDLWIGGKWRQASDRGRFDVIDPATENKIASVASATVDDARADSTPPVRSRAGPARSRAEAHAGFAQVLRADHARRRALAKLITLGTARRCRIRAAR
jgi:succinate-semialdehyde dehydrogenase/glutarate-semialdehyde dehydrogenase